MNCLRRRNFGQDIANWRIRAGISVCRAGSAGTSDWLASMAAIEKLSVTYKKPGDIKWNFTKFLVGRAGNVVKRFAPTADPMSFEADIFSEPVSAKISGQQKEGGVPIDRLLCLLIRSIAWISKFSRPLSRLGAGEYDEWKAGEKLKILLVGYNGAGNTGSDVRTVAIARQVNELFGKESVRMTVMTLDADSLEGCFDENVTLLPFSSIFPADLFRACSAHHAAILCEGSALKSGFANALTLFLCEAAGVMSAQGKPCIAYGVEAGYMEPFLERAAARLCRDAYFIARTDESLARLKKLGLRGHTGTDAAWNYDKAIAPDEADLLLRKQGWDGEKPLLGVAVINPFCWPVRPSLWRRAKGMISGDLSAQYDKWYFFSDSPERKKAFRRYVEEVAAGVCLFMREYDYFPVLIGMERLDESAVRALAGKLNCLKAAFLSGEYSAQTITGILRKLSAPVTSRYHAAVLSMETGCRRKRR